MNHHKLETVLKDRKLLEKLKLVNFPFMDGVAMECIFLNISDLLECVVT